MLLTAKIHAAAWRRGRWSCLAAGGSLTVLAVLIWIIALGGDDFLGFSRKSIGTTMRLEGYAFGTGFMLAILLPWCSTPGGPKPTSLKIAFAFTVGLMSLMLLSTDPGWLLLLQYLLLTGMTYLGALLDPRGAFTTSAWWLRVLTGTILFAFGTQVFHTPLHIDNWDTESSVIHLAMFYFSVLALVELSGIYHLQRADWNVLQEVWRR
ncbi:MAG: hypothetical protein KKG47_04975 [Proteobacteria bacterium]|nr:hypothetical protein [Pseudomonadota bacterium]MBU1739700.1 hypothetical protein [Pseudomonadota bacterium]